MITDTEAVNVSLEVPSSKAREAVHERVYRELRRRIISGQTAPGRRLTLRGLAAELGVSPMPVRAAVSRLVAERALVASANRRFRVPEMTQERFDELVAARQMLEPEAARRALPRLGRADITRLKRISDELEYHLRSGNVEGYAAANHGFHFAIYDAAASPVLVPLIESLWLQFGPFMRLAYGRLGTGAVVDYYHAEAIAAIERGDGEGVSQAISSEIRDGMRHIGTAVFDGTARHGGVRGNRRAS